MADLKTTNIYGDAYINNKVGIATNAPATRLQIGQLSPTAATEGIQFGDDTSTRLYRSSAGTLTLIGGFAGLTLSASTALYGNYGDWSGESNKIQWHSNNLYFVNRGGGSWLFRNSGGSNVVDIASNGTTTVAGNISAANLSGTNTGDQTVGNGTITIAAGTGVGVGTTNTFTTNQSGATTVTISNSGVTSNVAGTGISVSGATGAVTITNSSPNATHTGDVTGATALTIANDAVTTVKILNSNVTLAKIANITAGTILGNNNASAAAPFALTTAQVATMLSGQTMNIVGTASGENLGTVTGRGGSTGTQIIVATAAGQAMFLGRQAGSGYSYGSAGIFTALSDNPNGASNNFFQGFISSSASTPGGILTYSIRADGQIYTTMNTATGIANNSFNVGQNIVGSIHIANGGGTSGNSKQAAITFQGDSASTAQAGIYVSNNTSTGTAMAFATTDNYTTGPQIFMSATNAGVVNFSRARPTYAGNVLLDASNNALAANMNQNVRTTDSPTFAGLSLTSVSTTGATITNLTGAYQNTTVYDSPRTQSATPSRGIRAPASSIQFTDSYAIAPFYTYRSTGDWPVPYGIGWGTGGESSGIFQRYASNGSSFGDMIFYTGNDGSGAFSFRRHTWEGTTYFAAGSGELNTELFRIDWSGNLTMLGTLNGSANSATLYANNGSYGSWKIGGTRNGWYGIEFESGTNLMANSNEVGFHRNGHGWQLRWSNGVGYVYKGAPGGGTEATILDSSNQSYAWNMNQNVRSTDSPTFGTLQLTRLNFGAQAAAPYAAASGEGFGNGITFGGDENSAAYRIFTGMENIGGNYSKLTLNWHTGIRIGAYYGYGGIRFYDNYVGAGTKVFSIAESDSNVRVYNELFVQGGGIGSYGFLKYGGTRSGDWQLFTTSSGQINVVQVENFGAGGHTNYPTGVYTYGGVMSWRLPNHSFQLYAAHTGDLAYKTQWNNDNYSGWRRILDSSTYPYAANMNQYVRTTDTCSFAGLTVSNTINGSVTGNAATATTLQTARNINGTSFNGSAAITTATWGTARTLTIGSTGKSVDGSAAVSWSLAEIGAAATNQTMFIGTTSVAINRASAAIALAGTSIDGTAAGLNSSNYISRVGSSGNYNTDFQNTPAGTVRHLGDDATATNNPGGTWWFVDNYRHSNNSNYWGTQVAWGWEDNANKLATRNVLNGTFGSWVYYLNSVNYTNYTVTKTGTGASGNWAINAATVTNGVYTNTNNTLTGINVINNTSNTVINNQSGNLGLTMFQATAGTDAYMTFHIGSDYAAYLGLGGAENDLVYGGWSAGNNRHRILHSGNASFAWNMNQNVRTTDTCSFASVSAALFTGALNGTASELISGNTYTVGSLNVNTMAQLVGVKETYVAVAPASNVVTINLNAGTVFRMTYNSVISSFTLSNVTAGKVNAFTLISIASAGAGGITFTFTGYTLKWAGGTAPTATTTAGKFDVFSFIFDGTNWYGFTGGLNY